MDQHEARRRFTAARVARLATITPDTAPHLVPVVFALVQDVLYTAVDGKPKTTTALQRLANIDATGRASLLVDEYSEDWTTLWWVRVDGSAEVLAVEGSEYPLGDGEHPPTTQGKRRPTPTGIALGALTDKYPQYVSHPPPGPVIAIRVTRWRWWEASPSR